MDKVCEDGAVDRMSEVQRNLSEDVNPDEVVMEAEVKIAQDVVRARKQQMEKLFDGQHQHLLELGYTEAAGMDRDTFSEYICRLKSELDKVPENISEDNIPLLIVIPANIVPIHKQMSMVKVGGKAGYVWCGFYLAELKNADGVITPNVPYFITDVENGIKTRNISPENCIKEFAKEKRRGLTLVEGIALLTHYPETLEDHFIDLLGSCYGLEEIPGLWLYHDDPRTGYCLASYHDPYWGSASCSSVLGLWSSETWSSRYLGF